MKTSIKLFLSKWVGIIITSLSILGFTFLIIFPTYIEATLGKMIIWFAAFVIASYFTLIIAYIYLNVILFIIKRYKKHENK